VELCGHPLAAASIDSCTVTCRPDALMQMQVAEHICGRVFNREANLSSYQHSHSVAEIRQDTYSGVFHTLLCHPYTSELSKKIC